MTQTWLPKERAAADRATYEPVTCLACSKEHFICVETGHVLGEAQTQADALNVPKFPPKQFRRSYDRAAPSIVSDSAMPADGSAAGIHATTTMPKAC